MDQRWRRGRPTFLAFAAVEVAFFGTALDLPASGLLADAAFVVFAVVFLVVEAFAFAAGFAAAFALGLAAAGLAVLETGFEFSVKMCEGQENIERGMHTSFDESVRTLGASYTQPDGPY
jgi:hypothetical protein